MKNKKIKKMEFKTKRYVKSQTKKGLGFEWDTFRSPTISDNIDKL